MNLESFNLPDFIKENLVPVLNKKWNKHFGEDLNPNIIRISNSDESQIDINLIKYIDLIHACNKDGCFGNADNFANYKAETEEVIYNFIYNYPGYYVTFSPS